MRYRERILRLSSKSGKAVKEVGDEKSALVPTPVVGDSPPTGGGANLSGKYAFFYFPVAKPAEHALYSENSNSLRI